MTLLEDIRVRARRLFAADDKITHLELFTASGSSMGRIRRQDVMADKTPTGATCGSCTFFASNGSDAIGDCHRFPPANRSPRWPAVSNTNWCGEWRPTNRTLAEITEDMIRR